MWSECKKLPVGISNAQAVLLGDKLYMGGGYTSGRNRNEARLYIYTPTTDIWTTLDTLVYYFALVTYHGEVVLVGGRKYVGEGSVGPESNQLWTLDEQTIWQKTLPPMNVGRHFVSAVNYGEYILVAGGQSDAKLCDIVEVYSDQTWLIAEPLLKPCRSMKSSLFSGCWYLMGGDTTGVHDFDNIFFASLDSLRASCQPTETSQPSSVWKRLTDAPYGRSTPAIFGSRLTAIGGAETVGGLPVSFIHAFSPHTNSWIEVGNLPAAGCDCCTMVLSTVEIIVIGGFVNNTSQISKPLLKVGVIYL